jgi:putative transposase
MASFEVSQRRACAVTEQPRSTQRSPRSVPPVPEQQLRARLRQLAKDNPRYGYRRLHALLLREGYAVNHKRAQRLCRDEGLRVRVSRRKRARLGTSTTPADRLQAAFPSHVWALDFAFDQTADARVLKVLTITDEFTKTALAIEVERSITGDHLVRILDRLVAVHGHPRFIRMDNGPEMTCNAISDWCRFSATGSVFIEPGSPWQNAFVESFNGKLRDELLAIEVFHSLLEAKVMAEDYRRHHNTYRPHSSLGYRTPNEFTLD